METFLTRLPIAHRGLHGGRLPENSMSAFRAAIDAGYAIETDLRLTADRELVVFHDDTLERMTGVRRDVASCTLRELAGVRLAGTDDRIPTLRNLLEETDGRVPLLLELKNLRGVKGREFARALSVAMERYGGEYAVQSFHPFYVKAYRVLHPEIACGVLGTRRSEKADFGGAPMWKFKARAVANLSFNFTVKPDFVSYHAPDLPDRHVEKFKGVRLAWVVRSEEEEARVRQYADNIIFEGYLPQIKQQ